MNNSYKILLVEDSADDEMLIRRHFSKQNGNFFIKRVETSHDFALALKEEAWDIVVSDYTLPVFSAQAVLRYLIHSNIDLPVIVVSGKTGEETAVEVMRWGAKDFIPKSNLQRLIPSIFREITEFKLRQKSREVSDRLKFTEEKYQKFFDLNPAMIVVLTYPEERCLEANLQFIKTMGYSMEELYCKTAIELGIQSKEEHDSQLEDAKRNSLLKFRSVLCCKNGNKITCDISYAIIGESQNRLLFVMNDITDKLRLEAEQKLLENKFYQDQKLQAIGTLASGISHDFNNILSVILGNAEFLLMTGNWESNIQNRCERILQAGRRAADLIKQILTFTRESNGETVPVILHKVAKDSISMLKDIIPATIEIKSQILEVPPVGGDPNKFMQVITNLCVNASHAILDSKGSGLITVTLNIFKPDAEFLKINPDFENKNYARLSVADNGCGIPAENLAKIFDPFFTTKAEGKGTGLGLSTVYGIIKEFNGKILIDSELDIGTAFNIYLPILSNSVEAEESKIVVPKSSLPSFTGNILFVDDEEAIVDVGVKILTKLGLSVKGFTDSEEALDYFVNNYKTIDLIITDLTMPKLNGTEFLAKARVLRELPAIICSGQESKVSESSIDKDLNYYLLKPIMINDLIKTLSEVMGK